MTLQLSTSKIVPGDNFKQYPLETHTLFQLLQITPKICISIKIRVAKELFALHSGKIESIISESKLCFLWMAPNALYMLFMDDP